MARVRGRPGATRTRAGRPAPTRARRCRHGRWRSPDTALGPSALLHTLVQRVKDGDAGTGPNAQRIFLVRRASEDDEDADNAGGRTLLRVYSYALDMDVAYRTVAVSPTMTAAEVGRAVGARAGRARASDPPPVECARVRGGPVATAGAAAGRSDGAQEVWQHGIAVRVPPGPRHARQRSAPGVAVPCAGLTTPR